MIAHLFQLTTSWLIEGVFNNRGFTPMVIEINHFVVEGVFNNRGLTHTVIEIKPLRGRRSFQ